MKTGTAIVLVIFIVLFYLIFKSYICSMPRIDDQDVDWTKKEAVVKMWAGGDAVSMKKAMGDMPTTYINQTHIFTGTADGDLFSFTITDKGSKNIVKKITVDFKSQTIIKS